MFWLEMILQITRQNALEYSCMYLEIYEMNK